MPPCRCSDICDCVVVGEGGVSVTGSGRPGDPYVVSGEGGGDDPLAVHSESIRFIVKITQAAYDALPVKDPETLYLIITA